MTPSAMGEFGPRLGGGGPPALQQPVIHRGRTGLRPLPWRRGPRRRGPALRHPPEVPHGGGHHGADTGPRGLTGIPACARPGPGTRRTLPLSAGLWGLRRDGRGGHHHHHVRVPHQPVPPRGVPVAQWFGPAHPGVQQRRWGDDPEQPRPSTHSSC